MKVLVYGAGAVGGYLGARLQQHGHDVTLVTRAASATIINQTGLSVTEDGQTVLTRPTAVSSIAKLYMDEPVQFDLIIMSMKAYDLMPAIDPLVAFCPEPPTIITTQNGIDVERPLVEQYGAARIIAGSLTTPISKETSAGLTVARTDRGFALSPMQPGQDIRSWVKLFNEAAVDTTYIADHQAMKWSKALLNIVGNATSAILNRKPSIVYKSKAIFNMEMRMLEEALAIMEKNNIEVIDLPGSSARRLAQGVRMLPTLMLKPIMTNLVSRGRGGKMPSFHIDLASGKRLTEVIFHNGAIARAGRKSGIAAPVNQVLNDVLVKLTRDELDWEEFNGKPTRLLTELKKYDQQANRE